MLSGFVLAAVLALPGAVQATDLSEAVSKAISFHPTVHRDAALERAANERIDEAFAGYLPTLDVDVATGYEYTNSPTTRARVGKDDGRDLWRSEGNVIARQMLFDGFETPHRVASAEAERRAAALDIGESSERVAVTTTQLYLDVLRDQELLAIAEDNVLQHVEISDRIIGLEQAGRGSEADTAQGASRLALARSRLEERRGNLRNSIARYTETVGETPDDLVLPPPPPNVPGSIEAAIATAMANNPIILASANRVEARQEDIGVAEAALMPRLDAEVFGQVAENVDGVSGNTSDLNARIRGRYNVFNGLADWSRIKRLEEEAIAAGGSLGEEQRRIREETRVAYESMVTAQERIPPLRDFVDSAERVLFAYTDQFNVGRRSLLDLLDAQNERFTARSQLVIAEYRLLVSQYELLFTIGELLPTLGVSVGVAKGLPRENG